MKTNEIEIFRKAIEEEKSRVPTLVPVTPANISQVFLLPDPVMIYVSKSTAVPQMVKEVADQLKHELFFPDFSTDLVTHF